MKYLSLSLLSGAAYSASFCIIFILRCSDVSCAGSGKSSHSEDGKTREERLLDVLRMEISAGTGGWGSEGEGGGGDEISSTLGDSADWSSTAAASTAVSPWFGGSFCFFIPLLRLESLLFVYFLL